MPTVDRFPVRTDIRCLCLFLILGLFAGCGSRPVAPVDNSKYEGARKLYQQGEASFKAGDYNEAVKAFTQLLDEGPPWLSAVEPSLSREEVLYQRGLAYLKLGFPDTAIEDFTEALHGDSKHADAYAQRGRAYLAMDDSYRAIKNCTESIRLQALNPAAYRVRGIAYYQLKETERAVADLEQFQRQGGELDAEAASTLHAAYVHRSEDLAATGNQAAADELFAKAEDLQPEPLTEIVASVPAPGSGTPREVRAKPVPTDEETRSVEVGRHLLAGDELVQQKDFDGAIRELSSAIALEPHEGAGYAKRAAAWLKMGFADNAVMDADDAIRWGGESTELSCLKAEALLAAGDGVGATTAASEAIRRDPTAARSFAVRGNGYLRSGKFDEAIRDMSYAANKDAALAQEFEAKLAEAYFRRGMLRERAQQTADAKADFTQAAQLGWKAVPSATK